MSKIHAALEIGTSRTVLAVGETQAGGRMKILSHAEIPSSGVRKSQIIDISQATQSIRSVLREIEAKQDSTGGNVEIHNALLVASGQHIHVANAEGNAVVAGGRVGDAEIMEAARRSREMPIPNGRELLDIVDQDYQIDSLVGITSPKGMSGRMLRLNTLQIHASSDRIQDARTAAEGARLEISEPVFAATCTADAVLEEHERRNGVLVLDLGGGSTGYAAYCDGYLAAAGVVGVGGDHVTNDIAYAFQTTNAQAERLKTDEASAVIGQYTTDNARVRLTGSSALMESRAISRRALDTVVNARLKELFTVIRETLEGTQGHITFGLSRFLSRCFSHLIISEFSAVSPKVKLVLLEGSSPSLEDKLLDGDVDLALVAGRRNEPRLEYIHVINEKIVLAVPPSFAREFGLLPGENELPIPPEQLSRYPFILLRPSHGLRNYANFFFDQVGIRPPTSYETEEIDVAISLTNDDFGLSFTSAISAEMSTIVHPQYYCTLSNMPQQTRQISICRNKGVYHLKAEEDLIRITSDIVKKAILPL